MTSSPIIHPSTFASLSISEPLLEAIEKLGYTQPKPVQLQAIPVALDNRDLLVSAETGSGKTVAFLLSVLQQIISQPQANTGVRALILAPTRELAAQINECCQALIEFTDLNVGLITGGADFKQQQTRLKKTSDIIIATPGRLLEHLDQNPHSLNQIEFLVLDEADRMLDMGFSEDVLTIAEHCNQNKQTLLFSATLMNYGVIKIADKILKNYKTLALNTRHDSYDNIEQQIVLADDNDHKIKLLAWLLGNETYDKALIFTNTRLSADSLQGPLRGQKLRVGVLHGNMDQKDRNRIMALYREGVINILIATDLAARGLDVQGINLVVNFDIPRNGIDYIHRIGRTGRADAQGLTIALVKHTEWNLMSSIERFLRQNFIRRSIKELAGSYQGPKKLKSSGKAVGSKQKADAKKPTPIKVKIRDRDKKNIGKRRVPVVKPIADN
ncbi:MAG: DEAD/DEAH box helicase [Methylococcaceae bacterium]|nr:DEAD/DEAH box helicase [Methylococcaceae bacterium]